MPICFEADFKSDGYSSKNFVEAVYKSGFSTKNANFSLIKKNAAGQYVKDEICSEQLENAIESKPIDPVDKPYFAGLVSYLHAEKEKGQTIYPPGNRIFYGDLLFTV